MHFMYLGSYTDSEHLPPLADLLQSVLQIETGMQPPFPWMCTVDATHQHLFPRTSAEMEDKYDYLPKLYNILEGLDTKTLPYEFPATCQQEFPFMTAPRLLFVEPHYRMLHDGGCPAGCPRDSSVLVETAGGEPGNPGDVFESPCFAFFQLKSGEIFALCNWDYRD